MKERLTKRLDDGIVEYKNGEYTIRLYPQNEDCYNTEQKAILRLAEYEDLEEQGLLVRLPCKIGDKVYHIKTKYAINELEIVKTTLTGYCNLGLGLGLQVYLDCYYFSSTPVLAETVFLTRAEAEKKLEELKEKKNEKTFNEPIN